MLRTYALAPETLRRTLSRTFWRFQLIVTLSFLGFGAYLALFTHPIHWEMAGPMVGIIALAYFLVIFFNYRQQLRLLYSIRYEINGSSLNYRQDGRPPLHIMRADIVCIQECNEGLRVETIEPNVRLLIPNGLARGGDEDFRTTLQAWVGIERLDRAPTTGRWFFLVGVISSFLILLFANNLWVILLLGLCVLLFGLLAERTLQKGEISSPGTMRMYSMAFSFIIFVIMMKTCLLGMQMAINR